MDYDFKDFEPVKLVPVSEWVYDLYKVTYSKRGSGDKLVKYFVSSYVNHLEGDINDMWPSDHFNEYEWEIVSVNVTRPRVVGVLYGRNISESSLQCGMRMAKEKGFI